MDVNFMVRANYTASATRAARVAHAGIARVAHDLAVKERSRWRPFSVATLTSDPNDRIALLQSILGEVNRFPAQPQPQPWLALLKSRAAVDLSTELKTEQRYGDLVKRTIARADALYGVTMEEHGVSKLVGVKFSTREHTEKEENNDVLSQSEADNVPSVAETFGKSGNLHSENQESFGGVA